MGIENPENDDDEFDLVEIGDADDHEEENTEHVTIEDLSDEITHLVAESIKDRGNNSL